MKYVLSVLGFIILAVIAVTLLVSTTGNRTGEKLEGDKVVSLSDHKAAGSVIYTSQGSIVGDDQFRQVRITVNQSERRVELLAGYNGRVEKEQRFANNAQAFDVFMDALSKAGYSLERESAVDGPNGTCPLGRRFIYELRSGSENVVDLWSTSCGTKEGTFGGNATLVRQLFERQISEYNKFVSGVRF